MRAACDVLVIGGGVAGTAAALAAAGSRRVLLVRASPGATALCSGAWHDLPPDGLTAALSRTGYSIAAGPVRVLHPFGYCGTCAGASHTHAADFERATVCDIAGLPPGARGLSRVWAERTGAEFRTAAVEVAGTPAGGWSPVALARAIEANPELLASALSAGGDGPFIVPAVIGLTASGDAHSAIEARIGTKVIEMLGTPPSVPGWRLAAALDRALEQAGVDRLDGVARAHSGRGDGVPDIAVDTRDSGVVQVASRSIVLASGDFVGGGIAAHPEFVETVFGTPLRVEHLGETFPAMTPVLTSLERADQPVLALGLVDELRLPNVFSAGAVRAEMPLRRSAGLAAHDGWAAGLRAAEAA